MVGEVGGQRALVWRVMDAMQRRREWRVLQDFMRAWSNWFVKGIKVAALCHPVYCPSVW